MTVDADIVIIAGVEVRYSSNFVGESGNDMAAKLVLLHSGTEERLRVGIKLDSFEELTRLQNFLGSALPTPDVALSTAPPVQTPHMEDEGPPQEIIQLSQDLANGGQEVPLTEAPRRQSAKVPTAPPVQTNAVTPGRTGISQLLAVPRQGTPQQTNAGSVAPDIHMSEADEADSEAVSI